MNLLCLSRFAGIIGGLGSMWIARHPTRRNELLIIVGTIPVAGPLPYVPSHVVKTVAVGRILACRGDPNVSVRSGVMVGKVTLVSVRHPLAVRAKLITPYERLPGQPAPRGELPLGFCGKSLLRPPGVGLCIRVGNMHDGEILLSAQIALRTKWVSPVGPLDVSPPLKLVIQRNRVVRRSEND